MALSASFLDRIFLDCAFSAASFAVSYFFFNANTMGIAPVLLHLDASPGGVHWL